MARTTTASELAPVSSEPSVVKELENTAGGFGTRIAELRQAPLTRMTAELAGELMGDAKAYLAAVHEHFDPVVKDAFKTHRDATALRGKFLKPGEDADSVARDVARRIELKRQQDLDAERRRLEEEARLQAEAARALDVKALADDGRVEEATLLAQAPVIAPMVHVDPNQGAPSTHTGIAKKRGRITDMAKFLAFVAVNPVLWGLVEVKQGALDRFVNSTGAALDIPGVESQDDIIIRSEANRV